MSLKGFLRGVWLPAVILCFGVVSCTQGGGLPGPGGGGLNPVGGDSATGGDSTGSLDLGSTEFAPPTTSGSPGSGFDQDVLVCTDSRNSPDFPKAICVLIVKPLPKYKTLEGGGIIVYVKGKVMSGDETPVESALIEGVAQELRDDPTSEIARDYAVSGPTGCFVLTIEIPDYDGVEPPNDGPFVAITVKYGGESLSGNRLVFLTGYTNSFLLGCNAPELQVPVEPLQQL